MLEQRETHKARLSKHHLYSVYMSMRERTTNERNDEYKNYGGRGIKICDKWLNDFKAFYEWAIDNGYRAGLTIDRIDVNGNYEPDNCRWITLKEQQNNRTNNHNITYNNETHTLSEWANKLGINRDTLYTRINKLNWTIERAFTQ